MHSNKDPVQPKKKNLAYEFWEYTNIQTIAMILSIMDLNTMMFKPLPSNLSCEYPTHVSNCLLGVPTWMS